MCVTDPGCGRSNRAELAGGKLRLRRHMLPPGRLGMRAGTQERSGTAEMTSLETNIRQAREQLGARAADWKAEILRQRVTLLESEIRQARGVLDARASEHDSARQGLQEAQHDLAQARAQAHDLRKQLSRARKE